MDSCTSSCRCDSGRGAHRRVHITSLELRDYRNYTQWALEPERALTVLVGPNASGKTNVVEAIQTVTTGTSFRSPQWSEVVRWGTTEARIAMSARGGRTHTNTELTVEAAGTRIWKVNGVRKRRVADATRLVPAVVFTPDDLLLVKGSAEQRRASLDALGEQLSVTYGALRRDYTRVVRQRNALLKDAGDLAAISVWDEQLVRLGARLHVHRRRLANRVMQAAAPVYGHLAAGETLGIRFCDRCGIENDDLAADVTRDEVEDALRAELTRRRDDELSRRVTLAGPHRDDITFLVEGKDARLVASQGQQRTIALAWKWAEVTVIQDVLRRTPVLLLDDVMSELDEARRHALTDLVQRDVQTFITTTNTGYFDGALLRAARVVEIGEGGL